MQPDTCEKFMQLFQGRTDAFGTGKGGWVKRAPSTEDFMNHLEGRGTGIGIAPLRDDGTISFAAIDLDEPNFEAAKEMQQLLNFATSWIEKSRSGNAHVWCFFDEPVEAWIARAILRETTAAIGKPAVEVFPKQDHLQPGMVGNYINLPYHGDTRPILDSDFEEWENGNLNDNSSWMPVHTFVEQALELRSFSEVWRKRAHWLGISPPEQRERKQEFGQAKELHMCAEYIIANRDENPIREGQRNVVYFNLAKMLTNYEGFDHDEAVELLRLVRDSSDEQGIDHVDDRELERILDNAEKGGFTSTGCDEALMVGYTHPDCPIARGLK